MNEKKFYIIGCKDEESFRAKDGKTLMPVLLANTNNFDETASDWAVVYMDENNIDYSVAYVPYFAIQRDGSYKRKFRKEN